MKRLFLLLLLACAAPAVAQVPNRSLGLGGYIGDQTGITGKLYQRSTFAYAALLSYNAEQYLRLDVHGLRERTMSGTQFRYFYGPGVFVGVRDEPDDEIELGLSGAGGINVFLNRFEIFLQGTPRFLVYPGTDFDFGLGLGVRYYL